MAEAPLRNHAALALLLVLLIRPAATLPAQNPDAAPSDTRLSLSLGFSPDPREVVLLAGGPALLQRTDSSGAVFRGWVDETRPDVTVSYNGEGLLSLYFWIESPADTSLLVHTPDGRWFASNNYPLRRATGNLNPGIVVHRAPSGPYAIWVGTVSDAPAEARLLVSELGLFLDRR